MLQFLKASIYEVNRTCNQLRILQLNECNVHTHVDVRGTINSYCLTQLTGAGLFQAGDSVPVLTLILIMF